MKKRTCDPRLAARLAREPLYSLASAWQVAESLGERAADPSPRLRPARVPGVLPRHTPIGREP